MTNQTQPGYYAEYDLQPSQACEFIVRNASEMQSHVVMAFGWMSLRPEKKSIYHVEQIAEQIERIRELCDILQAHVDRAKTEAFKEETV
jgi:hypothetical protein